MDEALLQKLNYKEGESVLVMHAPEEYLQRIAGIDFDQQPSRSGYDFVQVFLYEKDEIPSHFEEGVKNLNNGGKLWFCYAKTGSELNTGITRDEGWDAAETNGFVAVRQVAIDDIWSALRFKPGEEVKNSTTGRTGEEKQAEIIIPTALEKALNANPFCKEFFNTLSYTNKKEYAEWITSAKKEETAQQRLEQTLEKLKAGIKNPHQK